MKKCRFELLLFVMLLQRDLSTRTSVILLIISSGRQLSSGDITSDIHPRREQKIWQTQDVLPVSFVGDFVLWTHTSSSGTIRESLTKYIFLQMYFSTDSRQKY